VCVCVRARACSRVSRSLALSLLTHLEAGALVKGNVPVDVDHLARRQVDEDVVEVSVPEPHDIANHRRHCRRPRIRRRLVPELCRGRARTPNLAGNQVPRRLLEQTLEDAAEHVVRPLFARRCARDSVFLERRDKLVVEEVGWSPRRALWRLPCLRQSLRQCSLDHIKMHIRNTDNGNANTTGGTVTEIREIRGGVTGGPGAPAEPCRGRSAAYAASNDSHPGSNH
jgi:hypothetical protein